MQAPADVSASPTTSTTPVVAASTAVEVYSFKLFSDATTWHAAAASCSDQHGEMASFYS